jgi:PAS domain S-box-containing protein
MTKVRPTYEELERRIKELNEELKELRSTYNKDFSYYFTGKKEHVKNDKDFIFIIKELFGTMPQGVVFQDDKGKIILANPAAEKILGLALNQMLGRTSVDKRWHAIHEDGSPFPGDTHPSMIALRTGNTVYNTVMGVFHTQTNKYKWLNINAYPLFKREEQKPFMAYTVFEDITERKKAEDSLVESEERYRDYIESSPLGILIHNKEGEILVFNNELENITAYSKEDFPDMDTWIRKIYPEEKYRSAVTRERAKISSDEKPRIKEAVITRKDGKKRICQFVSRISGTGIRTVFVSDITESKFMEDALRESEERFRAFIEEAPMGIVVHDMKGHILIANSLMYKYTGYSADEILTKNVADIDHEIIPKEHRRIYWQSMKVGEHVVLNAVHERKDKTTYPAEVRLVKIVIRLKPLILTFTRDVTQQKEYEIELKEAKEKAEESGRLKSAFLANMSHEIRTPLNGILGFADMLNNPELTDTKREHFIEIIQEGGQRLLQIVNDIIDISKIEAKQIKITESETCLNEILNELFTFYNPIAKKNSINLFLKKALIDNQSNILIDQTKLKQILQNLLSNAIKFTASGIIKFGYKLKNDFLEFYVEDTGIGIDPELHDRIFERFRQVETGLGKNYGGTGLGLSIAKAYVEEMKGKIWLSSKPGKGSRFYFTIPYKHIDKKEKKPSKNKNDNFIKGLKVLIVEDNDVNYVYLKEIIKSIKAKVLHARNGSETIKLFNKHPEIDIVLMDIKLPDMSGYEVTRELKKINPDIPVIAQTAYAMAGDREKSLESGCDEYIAKPIKQEELINLIMKYRKAPG